MTCFQKTETIMAKNCHESLHEAETSCVLGSFQLLLREKL